MQQISTLGPQRRWSAWLGLAGAVLLGAVLLVAAWAKLLEPGAFVQEIRREGLDMLFSAETVAVLALALEAGFGLALLLGVRHWTVMLPSTLLVVFLIFLTGRNYWLVEQGLRDPSESCGCFGSLWERTPAEAFWLDLLLLVPALGLAYLGRPRSAPPPWTRLALGLAAGIAVGATAWNSSDLLFSKVADQIASAPTDQTYRNSSGYTLRHGDSEVDGAKVYQSEGAVEILVDSPGLPFPVLIDPRSGELRQVERDKISTGEDGALRLPETKGLPVIGAFTIGSEGIQFEVGKKLWTLAPR